MLIAVERMLGAASQIPTNLRWRMGDETMDHLLLLQSRLSLDSTY